MPISYDNIISAIRQFNELPTSWNRQKVIEEFNSCIGAWLATANSELNRADSIFWLRTKLSAFKVTSREKVDDSAFTHSLLEDVPEREFTPSGPAYVTTEGQKTVHSASVYEIPIVPREKKIEPLTCVFCGTEVGVIQYPVLALSRHNDSNNTLCTSGSHAPLTPRDLANVKVSQLQTSSSNCERSETVQQRNIWESAFANGGSSTPIPNMQATHVRGGFHHLPNSAPQEARTDEGLDPQFRARGIIEFEELSHLPLTPNELRTKMHCSRCGYEMKVLDTNDAIFVPPHTIDGGPRCLNSDKALKPLDIVGLRKSYVLQDDLWPAVGNPVRPISKSVLRKSGNELVTSSPPLREWQVDALKAWRDNGHQGVVEAITGTGKTQVGIDAIVESLTKGGVSVVLVPTQALLYQWARTLEQQLPSTKIGRYFADQKDTFDTFDVIVAVVNSFVARPFDPPKNVPGLLVADEVHRYGSEFFANALRNSYRWRLGLSGSFERSDDGIDAALAPYFKRTVKEYNYGEALRDKVVAPFTLGLIGVTFTGTESAYYATYEEELQNLRRQLQTQFNYPKDPSKVLTRVSAYVARNKNSNSLEMHICRGYLSAFQNRQKVLSEASAKSEVVQRLGNLYPKLGGTLIFTESVKAVDGFVRLLSPVCKVERITGQDSNRNREERLESFKLGRYKVLCSAQVLNEGIDVPEAELAVIAAASLSRRTLVQRMGRVIRLKPDNKKAKLLIIYVKGTREDPDAGAHGGFLDSVAPYAEGIHRFSPNQVTDIERWALHN